MYSTSPVKIWRNQGKIQKLLGKEGTILSWTTIYVPPAGFEGAAPYIVALVALSSGMYTAQLVEWKKDHLHVGQKVRAILRRTKEASSEGIIPYGIKFQPI